MTSMHSPENISYKTCITYKPDPDLHIVDWLLRQNNIENKDEEIAGLNITLTVNIRTDIPTCITTKDIEIVMQDDIHLQNLRTYIQKGWLSDRNDMKQDIWLYLMFGDELVMISVVAMKGKLY